MIDLDELIKEARRLEGDYSDSYEVVTHMSVLADALESVRAERDAALARIAELERELALLQVPEGYPMSEHCEAHLECCGGKGYCEECYKRWPCPSAPVTEEGGGDAAKG